MADQRRQVPLGGAFDGERYQQRFDELAAEGAAIHGEADFVGALQPRSVLDAGCGTGRVAIELDRRGVEVTGVDVNTSMLATARERAPHIEWVECDLTELQLGRKFDVVVMAGNVPLFTPPGTQAALVAACARHVADHGSLVAGFQLGRTGFQQGRSYDLHDYDRHCEAAGLVLVERFATWDRDPFPGDGGYAVSHHRSAERTDP